MAIGVETMKGVPVSPRRVFGVALDVSEHAGRRTWVCRATPGSDGIRVESVDRLVDLPGGEEPLERALRVLVGKIVEAPRSAWGFDFPFGAPADVAGEGAPNHEQAPWRSRWVEALGTETEADDATARRTEQERGLRPAHPSRRHRGARLLLRPLADRSDVAILPVEPLPLLTRGMPPAMAAQAPSIYLLETAVAAVLRSLSEELGDESTAGLALLDDEDGRQRILRALVRARWVRPMARRLRLAIGENPRALDAVLIAVGAWRGCREYDHGALCRDGRFGIEGMIYC